MADALAILGCILALAGSFVLLSFARCQHYRMSYGGGRCADCGMSAREIKVNHRLKLDTRRIPHFTSVGECPYDPVFDYLLYTLVKAPPGSQRTYDEVCEFVPGTPPHIKELYESMMLRQHGIAWLWKKHV